MPRPNLLEVRYREQLQQRILHVLVDALRRLSARQDLPQAEDPINRKLYFCILDSRIRKGRRREFHPISHV